MAAAGGGPEGVAQFEQWGAHRVLVRPPLGCGLTSQVYLSERGGVPYALKRYATGKAGLNAADLSLLRSSASAELAIMQGLVHPHIVRVHGEVDVGEDICVPLDFAPGASAKARMHAPRGSTALLPLDLIAWIARDIAQSQYFGREYTPTPVADIVTSTTKTAKDIAAATGYSDKEVSDHWLKHAIQTAGYTFGLPLGQPAQSVQWLWDVWNGDQDPKDMAGWLHGIMYGKVKEE